MRRFAAWPLSRSSSHHNEPALPRLPRSLKICGLAGFRVSVCRGSIRYRSFRHVNAPHQIRLRRIPGRELKSSRPLRKAGVGTIFGAACSTSTRSFAASLTPHAPTAPAAQAPPPLGAPDDGSRGLVRFRHGSYRFAWKSSVSTQTGEPKLYAACHPSRNAPASRDSSLTGPDKPQTQFLQEFRLSRHATRDKPCPRFHIVCFVRVVLTPETVTLRR